MRKIHRATSNITAMKILIGCYVTKTIPKHGCPLCAVNKDVCLECPWVVMTDGSCRTNYYEVNDSLFSRIRRILQLRKWIQYYERHGED